MGESQTERLFRLNLAVNQWLVDSKAIIRQIEQKNDPRKQFNCWKGSKEGIRWKKLQYAKQEGCCAICSHSMPLKGAHIDHIKPISKHPELALDTANMRLACLSCNSSKGNK